MKASLHIRYLAGLIRERVIRPFLWIRDLRCARRRYAKSEREVIKSDEWEFARVAGVLVSTGRPTISGSTIYDRYLPTSWIAPGIGFLRIYCNPLVLGLGHIAVRDFMFFEAMKIPIQVENQTQ